MHAWETIDQSLNYIEEHLSGEIFTEELADMVGLSQFYYQRLFKRLVRKPVQEYAKPRQTNIYSAHGCLGTTSLQNHFR